MSMILLVRFLLALRNRNKKFLKTAKLVRPAASALAENPGFILMSHIFRKEIDEPLFVTWG